jgi:hypothetical protein
VGSRENGCKTCLAELAGHSLQSGFEARIAELRRFRGVFRGMQPGFSAAQTEWRRTQSAANLSPREFPGNREKNREFLHFCFEFIRVRLASTTFHSCYLRIPVETEQGIIRGVTGKGFPCSGGRTGKNKEVNDEKEIRTASAVPPSSRALRDAAYPD